jgi:HK97 family phage portal protein
MIPEDDIFHLRDLGFNMLMGLSRIAIARDSFGVALGLEQQAARFMANGAGRAAFCKRTSNFRKTQQRLRTQWEQLRSGIQNAGRTAILEEGLKWNAMQLSSVDLEFIAQREFSIGDVARWFDMPLYKLGVKGEMARIKFDDADQAYVNTTIMPDLDAWEQKFVQKFDLDKEGLTPISMSADCCAPPRRRASITSASRSCRDFDAERMPRRERRPAASWRRRPADAGQSRRQRL